MIRRTFLKNLLGLAAVPIAAKLPVVAPETKVLKDMYGRTMRPVITKGNFGRALWPGIKKWSRYGPTN